MRQVGTLASQQDAERFVDYLLTQGVPARADGSPAGYDVWVVEENDVTRAKQSLGEFQANPTDPRYGAAQSLARHLRGEQAAEQRKAQRRIVDMSTRWNAPVNRRIPVTIALIVVSVAVTLLSGFDEPGEISYWLSFSLSGMKLAELRTGQLWRLWTSAFLHVNVMHLAFNMYWLYLLGGMIELRRGPWVLMGVLLASELGADVGQLYVSQPYFAGFSGAVFGLFGYVWMKSRFDPATGLFIDARTVVLMLAWLFIGPMLVPNIANAAHVGGLIVGVTLGYPLRNLLH